MKPIGAWDDDGQPCVILAFVDQTFAVVTHGGQGRLSVKQIIDLRIVPNEDFPLGWVKWPALLVKESAR